MPNVKQDFTALVERVKQRDDGAMCRLIEQYGTEMLRFAEKLVGQALQAHLDAADAVQTVQVTLWVGIRTGRFSVPTPDHFLALAKVLLRRHIARCWRKAKNEMARTLEGRLIDTMSDQDFSSAFKSAEPQNHMEVDELLERFLSQVDEIDQQLVKMRFLGYTTSEAANRLQLDSGFLRVRLGRLRQRFANFLPLLESKA
jgi:RNA polymerase sigma factor (sigma-70 family)